MTRRIIVVGLLGLCASVAALAQEDEPLSKEDSLKVLTAAADNVEIKLAEDDKLVERFEKPVYRYTDPVRKFQDGTLWAWGKKGRPVALTTITQDGDDTKLVTETLVLADVPIELAFTTNGQRTMPYRRNKQAKYSDQLKELAVAPTPTTSGVRRALQAKSLARKFNAYEYWNNDAATESRRYQLRLLPKPVHQYEDEKAGILHGSIFLFNYGSNPELCLVLEAYQQGWKCGFLRLGHARAVVELDGKEFYSHRWYSGRDPHYVFSGMIKPKLN